MSSNNNNKNVSIAAKTIRLANYLFRRSHNSLLEMGLDELVKSKISASEIDGK